MTRSQRRPPRRIIEICGETVAAWFFDHTPQQPSETFSSYCRRIEQYMDGFRYLQAKMNDINSKPVPKHSKPRLPILL